MLPRTGMDTKDLSPLQSYKPENLLPDSTVFNLLCFGCAFSYLAKSIMYLRWHWEGNCSIYVVSHWWLKSQHWARTFLFCVTGPLVWGFPWCVSSPLWPEMQLRLLTSLYCLLLSLQFWFFGPLYYRNLVSLLTLSFFLCPLNQSHFLFILFYLFIHCCYYLQYWGLNSRPFTC
jgi:hypothetical protein